MNRYSDTKVVVENPVVASLGINGVFRSDDTIGFASAVARSYGLTLQQTSHELRLIGAPSSEGHSTAHPNQLPVR